MTKKCKTAAIHWEIHSKKGSAVLAWRLTKYEGNGRYEVPIWVDDGD